LGSALDCLNVYDYFCIPGTGRLTIWDAMIYDALVNEVHLFGYGVGVFFATLDYSVLSSVGLGSFIPHDSHNGFVDLFVNFGLIGVILFLCIFILFYLSFLKVDDFSYLFGLIFLFVYIMSNISESYFLKGFNFLPVFFYILLFYYSKDGRIQK
jgi:O-antigen ligase